MKVWVGIDLGSTTTKAVAMTEAGEILGRGITNSRSNYDVACAVAREDAMTTARFELLRQAIDATPARAARATALVRELRRAFHGEQYARQLEALAATCLDGAGASERPVLEDLFGALRVAAAAATSGDGSHDSAGGAFFRDLAGSAYLRLAEEAARTGAARFDRLMGLFDRAILRVENEPPDLSFAANIGAAVERAQAALGGGDEQGAEAAGRLAGAVRTVLDTPLEEADSVGTGYGRARLPFPKERIRSEILCHGLGAHYFFPRTTTVLDIGGQDTKAIQLDADGLVTGFQMNDRCAAGCGRYLGYIADEMNLGLHELGPLARLSRRPVRIASTCTVFAGAELRDRLAAGERREDILAGLHRAIILRAMSLLARSGGVHDEFTFTGGVARNSAALEALRRLVAENYGSRTLNVSPDSIYTGAVGAALFARRGAAEGGACAA